MIKNPPQAVSDYGERMLTGRSKNLKKKHTHIEICIRETFYTRFRHQEGTVQRTVKGIDFGVNTADMQASSPTSPGSYSLAPNSSLNCKWKL